MATDADQPTYSKLKQDLNTRRLKIFHQDVNGLYFKIDKLRILLQETMMDIHIFGITETHLNGSIKDKEIHITAYDTIRKDRKHGSGGDVCAYFREDLSWHRRPDLENEKIEAIWIELVIP